MTDAEVQVAYERGRAAFPRIDVSQEIFQRWLGESGIDDEDLSTHCVDLFLAAACAAGNRAAHECFDASQLSGLTAHEVGLDMSADAVTELKQRLRLDLIGGAHPKIAQYRGRGPLRAWVKVCAARSALRLKQQASNQLTGTDQRVLDALISQDASPEYMLMRAQYHDTLAAALEECLASLPLRDRTLLRMSFMDGLNIDQIGLAYRVHRSTAARWLLGIRRRVLDQLGTKVSLKLNTSSSEFRSVVRLLQEDVHLSLSRVLATDGPAP
jgi:RNA polymerase sigma-70 factor (ECF subfamily)